MHTAAALLYPDALATSITLPMEILHAASQLASVTSHGAAQGEFLLLSAAGDRRITLSSGLALSADGPLEHAPAMEMLILPAIWRSPTRTLRLCANLLPDLRRRHEQGTLLCSVGTASCLLAEAGLLTGRSATTHWNYFDRFEKRYPDVHLKRRHLITQSGNI
ncbi:MAG: DJ-1/PfpI family protein, partial [Chromatocurvus sp.]